VTRGGRCAPHGFLASLGNGYGGDDTPLELHTKLQAAGVPVAAHFIAQGKHAFNLGDRSRLIASPDARHHAGRAFPNEPTPMNR
jgi:hypothetical protein